MRAAARRSLRRPRPGRARRRLGGGRAAAVARRLDPRAPVPAGRNGSGTPSTATSTVKPSSVVRSLSAPAVSSARIHRLTSPSVAAASAPNAGERRPEGGALTEPRSRSARLLAAERPGEAADGVDDRRRPTSAGRGGAGRALRGAGDRRADVAGAARGLELLAEVLGDLRVAAAARSRRSRPIRSQRASASSRVAREQRLDPCAGGLGGRQQLDVAASVRGRSRAVRDLPARASRRARAGRAPRARRSSSSSAPTGPCASRSTR